MSKQESKQESKLDDLAPIKIIRLRGDGIKLPNMVGTIEVDDGETPIRVSATYKAAQKLEWHQIGVRVWFPEGGVVVIPYQQIDAIEQVRLPKTGRR